MNRYIQKGVGLIEVMVTVLILSTSLMALAALQTRSLQYNNSAYLRSQANIMAYDLIDRIRVVSAPTGAPAALSNADIESVVDALPDGVADIGCVARVCTINITWTEPTATVAGAAEETTFTYVSQL